MTALAAGPRVRWQEQPTQVSEDYPTAPARAAGVPARHAALPAASGATACVTLVLAALWLVRVVAAAWARPNADQIGVRPRRESGFDELVLHGATPHRHGMEREQPGVVA